MIRTEALYLALITLGCPIMMGVLALQLPRDWLGISVTRWEAISPWAFAWLGGMLGGALFSMKWMYHSVAKGIWNQDRRLWRLFTPLLSGGVGFTIVVLSAARVVPLFGADIVQSNRGALAVAIVVGYFSDHSMSRLAAFAEGHLGGMPQRGASRGSVNEGRGY